MMAGCLMMALTSVNCQDKGTSPGTAAAAPSGSRTFTGKVIETMNAASYTYVRVDTGKEKIWAAAPMAAVKVGDSVTIADGMPMPNYQSKTLKRTFEMLYFAGEIQVAGGKTASAGSQQSLPAGHPPLGGSAEVKLPAGHPPLDGSAAKPKVDFSGIQKAKGGKTIKEIFAEKAALSGKEIVVRGKVVKYNSGIMNKNWLHIQDGTGADGSNDLTITTTASAKLGDTVLVTGKVTADKDFGFGYKFGVIIEDAKVVVE